MLGVAQQWLWRVLAVSVALGAVLCLAPAPPLKRLVNHGYWRANSGFFENNRPGPQNLEQSVLDDPHARFFRSWSGAPVVGARVWTAPFLAPRVLIVPFVGYPTEPGLSLDLECMTDGRTMPIATGNAHETWARALIVMPENWCADGVRIVATDNSEDKYVGFGTPYAGSWWHAARQSAFSALFIQTMGFGLVVFPLLALAVLLARRFHDHVWLIATAVYGLVAYAAFFIYQVGQTIAASLCLAFLLGCGWVLFRWMQRPAHSDDDRFLNAARNVRIAYAFSLVAALLLDLVDTRVGIWASAYRFSPASWSSDHLIPMMVADGIWNDTPLKEVIGGIWHVSDRPPLLSGVMLIAKPLIAVLGAPLGAAAQLMRAVAITTAALGAVVIKELVARHSDHCDSRRLRATAILLGLLSPFLIFNTVYTWPKLQGAYLALGAVLVLTQMKGPERRRAVLAGLLAGEAMLMHAGVAFGLLAFPVALRANGWRWRTESLFVSGLTAVLVWLPWSLWQRFVDPPGNGLIKVLLTGDRMIESESVWDAFQATISNVTLKQWLGSRVDAVRALWGGGPEVLDFEHRVHGKLDSMRLADFLEPLTMWRFLGLAALVAVVVAVARRKRAEHMTSALLWLLCGAIGVSVGLVASWKYNVTHHHSYFSLCCVLIALLALLLCLPRHFAWGFVALQAVYVVVVWVVHPMLVNGAAQLSASLLFVPAVVLLWVELAGSLDDLVASAKIVQT